MADLPQYGQPIAQLDLSAVLDQLAGQVVTSVTGTAGQIAASPVPGVGAVTLSLPSGGTLPGSWTINAPVLNGVVTTTGLTLPAHTSGAINMANAIITNIGNAGTDFDINGGLTLASTLILANGTALLPSLRMAGDSDTGFFAAFGIQFALTSNGNPIIYVNGNDLILSNQTNLRWTTAVDATGGTAVVALTQSALAGLGLTSTAISGGATAFTITQGAHTAVITQRSALNIAAATITLADTTTIAAYGWAVLNAPTFAGVAGGGAEVITDAATLQITGAPIQGSNITLTRTHALHVVAGRSTFGGPLYPATDALVIQSATSLYAGTGAPNNANGADGDVYFRSDGGALTTVYQRRAGVWVGVT